MMTTGRQFRAFAWWALMSAVLVAAHVALNSSRARLYLQDYNAARLQKVFSRHEAAIHRELHQIADSAAALGPSHRVADVGRFLNDSPYSYYVFDADTLVAWHRAVVPLAHLTPGTFRARFMRFDNGWYYVAGLRSDTLSVFGLFRIKSLYAFENEYLDDALHPSFGLSGNLRVSSADSPTDARILTSDGSFLFSIRLSDTNEQPTFVLVADFVMLLLLVLTLMQTVRSGQLILIGYGHRNLALFCSLLMLASVYGLMLSLQLSPQMSEWFVFSPSVFAYANWMPSLGYLFLLSVIISVWCYWVFRFLDFGIVERHPFVSHHPTFLYVLLLLLLLLVYIGLNVAIDIIVRHSVDLAIYIGSLDVSGASMMKLAVISLLTLAFWLVLERVYVEIVPRIGWRKCLTTIALFAVLAVFPASLLFDWLGLFVFVWFIIINLIYFMIKRNRAIGLKYSTFVWMMFLFALFVIIRMSFLNIEKERRTCNLLVHNLSFQLMREDDPVAEMLLLQMESSLRTDSTLQAYVSTDETDNRIIYSYLRERFFDGYFTRYDMQVIPCYGAHSTLQIAGSNESYECYSYFANMLSIFGVRIAPKSNFYCLKDNDGRPSYFGKFSFYRPQRNSWMHLYIEINAKPMSLGLGYPELLTNSRDRVNIKPLHGFSYAKYLDGRLVSRHGDFNYNTSDTWYREPPAGVKTKVDYDGFSHLVYTVQDRQVVVLSYPKLTVRQFVADFSYVFLGMFIFISLVLSLIKPANNLILRHTSIQERIQFSFIMFVMILLILLCVVSGFYSSIRFEENSRQQMSQSLSSVVRELETGLAELNDEYGVIDNDQIDNCLQKCSNIFMLDVHLYSTDGQLIATSRRELFDMGVAAPQMNAEVLAALGSRHVPEYIAEESIGRLSYYSCYASISDEHGRTVGYVNLPFFMGADALHDQVLAMVVAVTNSYLFFVILAIGFAIILSRRIVSPLMSISEGLKNIGLGKNNVKINYSGTDDEIGLLVSEYNRMLDELALSAEKLAVSERDMTWREMAKQIAHEIKNPLTPMKLSVQYLQKAWDEHRAEYGTYLSRVSTTLIEQIDQLTVIASEFSSMAKMPVGQPENIDVVDRLRNAVALFERVDGCRISLAGADEVGRAVVFANGEQLTSVFNNLIKNAIQSAQGREVTIGVDVSIVDEGNRVLVSVRDNGRGIAPEVREKIFKPNFTTKSTGMGLGLAIVKAIVVGLNGRVWFESEVGVGSCFYVELPLGK